jgi:Tfp pilus assembly protein FimT
MPRRRSSRGLRGSPAFSLLELLLVLALFGLVGTLVVGAVGTMLRDSDRNSALEKSLHAISQARHDAVFHGEIVDLRYDDKLRLFAWGRGTDVVGEGENVRLLPAQRVASMLVGGRLVEQPLARVRFYPDGTCDPFRLEIVRDRASQFLAIDPWTCTPLAEDNKTRGRR